MAMKEIHIRMFIHVLSLVLRDQLRVIQHWLPSSFDSSIFNQQPSIHTGLVLHFYSLPLPIY